MSAAQASAMQGAPRPSEAMGRAPHAAADAAGDLDLFSDTAAMQALLQSRLPGFAEGRLRLDGLAVDQVRRNTSQLRNPRRLSCSYSLRVREPATGRQGTQVLHGEVFRHAADAAAVHGASLAGGRLVAPAFGEALVHLPELGMLLWALPNDPALPQLPALLDPARAAAVVPGAAADALSVELLRYAPQQRATLRYTLRGAATGATRSVYAKTFRDDRAATIDARFRHFWQAAQTDPAAPLVAEPLGHDADLRTIWQAPAAGVPLRELLDGDAGVPWMARVAQSLARLHAAPLAPTATATPRSAAHWVAEVRRRQQKIGRIDAALAARAAAVADAIAAQADTQSQRPLSLIHGDWHPDQVWIDGTRVLLFDFDEFTLGDPMEDLAEFVLKLEQREAPAAQTRRLVDSFVAHYAAAAPARFDAASLAWHLAIQSLLQASRAFIYQQPGWAATLHERLRAAERRAAALCPTETR